MRVPIGYWIIDYDNNDPSNGQEWKTFAPGGYTKKIYILFLEK